MLVLVVVVWILNFAHVTLTMDPMCQLPSNAGFSMPKDYIRQQRPAMRISEPTVVHSVLYLKEIQEVNDKGRTIILPIQVLYSWHDHRISVNSNSSLWDYPSHSPNLVVGNDFARRCIWLPNIGFLFGAVMKTDMATIEPMVVKITQSGHIFMNMYMDVTIACHMEFDMYPFDKQTCFVQQFPFHFGAKEVVLDGILHYDKVYQRNLQYDMEIESSGRKTDVKLVFGQNITTFGFRINLRRKLLPHFLETFLPTWAIVAVSWISFVISPDIVPGRMAMLVTLLLVLVNISLRIMTHMPRSNGTTALCIWSHFCILNVILVIFEYSIILFIMRENEDGPCGSKMRGMVVAHKADNNGDANSMLGTAVENIANKQWRQKAFLIDKVSIFLFPVFNLVLSIFYWAYYLAEYNSPFDNSFDFFRPSTVFQDYSRINETLEFLGHSTF